MVSNNYKKQKSEKTRPAGKFTDDNKESDYSAQREQINFSLRVENYMRRHPEFLDELQRRMDEDESSADTKYDKNQITARIKDNSYTSDNDENKRSSHDFGHLSESDMEKISGEISGLLFKKDESHKSFLEKKAEEAVSGMVFKYLSNFMK